jgi:hypothetical protein
VMRQTSKMQKTLLLICGIRFVVRDVGSAAINPGEGFRILGSLQHRVENIAETWRQVARAIFAVSAGKLSLGSDL